MSMELFRKLRRLSADQPHPEASETLSRLELLKLVLAAIRKRKKEFKTLLAGMKDPEKKGALIQQAMSSVRQAMGEGCFSEESFSNDENQLVTVCRQVFGLEYSKINNDNLLKIILGLDSVSRWRGAGENGFMVSCANPEFRESNLAHCLKMIILLNKLTTEIPNLAKLFNQDSLGLIARMVFAHDTVEIVVGDISHGQDLTIIIEDLLPNKYKPIEILPKSGERFKELFKEVEALIAAYGRVEEDVRDLQSDLKTYEDRLQNLSLPALLVKFLDKLDACLTANQIFYTDQEFTDTGGKVDEIRQNQIVQERIETFQRVWCGLGAFLAGVKLKKEGFYAPLLSDLMNGIISHNEGFMDEISQSLRLISGGDNGSDDFQAAFFEAAQDLRRHVEQEQVWSKILQAFGEF